MAFSFGFSGDDIDIDDSENNSGVPDVVVTQSTANALPELVKANQHDMNELVRFGPKKIHKTSAQPQKFVCGANCKQLSILPSQIFYNRLAISETSIVIARREIIDIRTQLMAEDSADHDNAELIAGLEEGDLKPHFYEGGFKTWECALDLAKLVASEDTVVESLGDSQTNVHIIEVFTAL